MRFGTASPRAERQNRLDPDTDGIVRMEEMHLFILFDVRIPLKEPGDFFMSIFGRRIGVCGCRPEDRCEIKEELR